MSNTQHNIKSAFYTKNKIVKNSITDFNNSSTKNLDKIIDPMKYNKYTSISNSQAETIEFNIDGEFDCIGWLNSNIKTYNIYLSDFTNSNDELVNDWIVIIEGRADISNRFWYFDKKSDAKKIKIEIEETFDGLAPFIGYLFCFSKIGDIDLFNGTIEVKPRLKTIKTITSDGSNWTTIINSRYFFECDALTESANNIFNKIKNDYLFAGQKINYIHHYGCTSFCYHYNNEQTDTFKFNVGCWVPNFNGIVESIIFDDNFEYGENHLNNDSNYTGFSKIKGLFLPSGGGF